MPKQTTGAGLEIMKALWREARPLSRKEARREIEAAAEKSNSKMPRARLSKALRKRKAAPQERLSAIMGSGKRTKSAVAICIALIAAAALEACVFGAGNRAKTVDEIIQSEPHFTGIVAEIQENAILVAVNEGEDARRSSDLMSVPLDVVNPDGAYSGNVGDEVTVYYDGMIAESYPAQISKVYAILVENRAGKPFSIDDIDRGTTHDEIRAALGEPDGVLSGFWGDIYELGDGRRVTIYYDANGFVDTLKIFDGNGFVDIVPPQKKSQAKLR